MDYDAATDEKGDTIGVLAPSSSKPVILEEPNKDNGVGSPMAITAAPEHVGCFTLSGMEVFLRNRITDNARPSALLRVNSKTDMTPLVSWWTRQLSDRSPTALHAESRLDTPRIAREESSCWS